MIDINKLAQDQKVFEKVTPKYQTIAEHCMIWMRDNDVRYRERANFHDKMFIVDGIEYSSKELFDIFMKDEYGR